MSAILSLADVLLVVPVLHPSGAERVVAELAKGLPSFGFSTSVLCLEDEKAAIGVELKSAGIAVFGLNVSRRRSLSCARAIARHITQRHSSRPLIVCAQLFHANIAVRLAWLQLPKSIQRNVRILNTIQVAERRFRPWQFALDRLTAKSAAYEICVATSVAEFQSRKTGLPKSFFKVIENGTNLDPFAALNRERIPRPANDFRVVSVGRLNAQKDYSTLLHAWKRVAESLPAARLQIAGSGPEEMRLKRLCDALRLESVTFVGFCSDVPAFLNGADLYVQSSAWEGLPLSVIEAMAAGLPVIASAVDSLPDVIQNGRNGILFERGNHVELARSIIDLLNASERRIQLGAAARDTALMRFTANRMTADYAQLFMSVLLEQRQ